MGKSQGKGHKRADFGRGHETELLKSKREVENV
jgi:hypothetical protein